jgi:hypothetical protein
VGEEGGKWPPLIYHFLIVSCVVKMSGADAGRFRFPFIFFSIFFFFFISILSGPLVV